MSYLPPPSTPSDPPPPWLWTPDFPTFPPPTTSFSSSSHDDFDSSSSSTATFGIVIGVSVGVVGVILLVGIWYMYLRKKCRSECSK
ncbi:hypothetical protein PHAVU_003G022500 [Phaseolus vulgaris]|uniref:Uncharacterized protein n=1 Tax=Phaseolus vulgaris TaxID=3885 RepID=V7C581_PHAVU|nr:hypothetical protein PHAVU_003G022500g [Phaseolus vulgaris]ESW25279.1 hypothetical protein PHAVU_003G022500g [Phaseolus vulgaris]